ncbi:DeoR/GlpR family DNA-binding transcription regulator [Exiguobacterium flavidum]|uniref:DeoR/GlpR family DNA-binding transcription regulator n=1 Tax=Exiguobacterium flavidum TaxID=2184695 RepID=UPI000DF7CCA3|nr:DeoR/GlpR family DNA-binding transcription regulator [Exiguobacterium flavidum]
MTALPHERRDKIIEILESKDYAEVSYLSGYFNVSEMTIRRDLEKLDRDGQIIRVYGGARLVSKTIPEQSFTERAHTHPEEKALIAEAAVRMIEDGDVVAFDASTSALEVSKRIKHFRSLTVVTNNINIAIELADVKNIAVILLGGYLRGKSLSTTGASLRLYMQSIYIDKAFISSKAISVEEGLTDSTSDEGEAKQAMLQKSSQVVVLADRSKLGTIAFFKVCSSESIDVLITDGLKPMTPRQEEVLDGFRAVGTNVIVAAPGQ